MPDSEIPHSPVVDGISPQMSATNGLAEYNLHQGRIMTSWGDTLARPVLVETSPTRHEAVTETPTQPPTGAASSRMAEDDYWDSLPPTLTSKDLQRLLNIGQATVSLWLNKGTIPGHQIAYSWITFRSDVRTWLESTSTVPFPEHEPYPDPLDEYGDHLTYQDLMVLFRKSRPAIFGWLRDGTIPAMRPGQRWLIEKNAIRRLLEQTSNQRPDFVPRKRRDELNVATQTDGGGDDAL